MNPWGRFFGGNSSFGKFIFLFCKLSYKKLHFFKKNLHRDCQNCILRVHTKIVPKNIFFEKFRANFGLWAKNLCPFQKIFSALLSKLLCVAGVHRSFLKKKKFSQHLYLFVSLLYFDRQLSGSLSKTLHRGCQKCILLFHRNHLREISFFSKKIVFLHHIWTISETISSFCRKIF